MKEIIISWTLFTIVVTNWHYNYDYAGRISGEPVPIAYDTVQEQKQVRMTNVDSAYARYELLRADEGVLHQGQYVENVTITNQ
jgi:hypothetical protein